MQTENNWYEKVAKTVAEKKIHKKDYKFFQIERFLRAARRIDRYAIEEKCLECEHLRSTIEQIASNLDEYINESRQKKREYERMFDEILVHLKGKHQLIPYSYYVALFSLFGMLAGAALGAAIGMLISPKAMKIGGLIGWAIGLIAGRLTGSRKDYDAKRDNRTF